MNASTMQQGRVSRVRVFTDRAAVTRTRILETPTAEIVFAPIPLGIDESSLRAKVEIRSPSGSVPLKVSGISSHIAYAEPDEPRRKEIDSAIEAIEMQLHVLEREESNETQARALLTRYANIASRTMCVEWLDKEPMFDRWTMALDHLRTQQHALAVTESARNLERRKLGTKLHHLLDEQRRVGSLTELGHRVVVRLEGPTTQLEGAITAEITYLTDRAQWTPSYDARQRVDAEGKDKIELTAVALVLQSTGEDWEDVELVATTARPPLSEPPPLLAKLVLRGYQGGPAKQIVSTEASEASLEGLGDTPPPDAPATVEHLAPGLISIPASRRPVRVELFKTVAACRTRLEVAPRERAVPVTIAELENKSGRVLLPGWVNLFREARYSGRCELPFVAAGEVIRLPLGTDGTVRIKREVLVEPEKKGVITGATTHLFRTRNVLENLGPLPIEIVLRDRIPVSRTENATVKVTESEPALHIERETGLTSLTVSLAPHAKREVLLEYKVTAPRGFSLDPPPSV